MSCREGYRGCKVYMEFGSYRGFSDPCSRTHNEDLDYNAAHSVFGFT